MSVTLDRRESGLAPPGEMDLEAMGLPPGLAGLKLFRTMLNAAFRFEGDKVAERWDRVDVDDLMAQLTGPEGHAH
jgi:predicted ester cyclase